jgi:hypothetical protein
MLLIATMTPSRICAAVGRTTDLANGLFPLARSFATLAVHDDDAFAASCPFTASSCAKPFSSSLAPIPRQSSTEAATAENFDAIGGFAAERWLAVDKLRIYPDATEYHLGPAHAHTAHRDVHPNLRADCVLAIVSFNASVWLPKDDEARWQFSVSLGASSNNGSPCQPQKTAPIQKARLLSTLC